MIWLRFPVSKLGESLESQLAYLNIHSPPNNTESATPPRIQSVKLTEDKSISFQSYVGKEWTMENAQEIINFRVYFIKERVYILAARQPKAEAASFTQIVSGFFDSFALLK